MPLQDQLFSQITTGVAPINPGVGGWDVLISQFFDDRRGRHGFGLLARVLDLAPQTSPGSILVSVQTGWSCLPMFVGLKRVAAGTIGNFQYQVTGQAAGAPTTWRPTQTSQGLNAREMKIIWPSPLIFTATEADIPIVDGDDVDRNTFNVIKTSGGSQELDFFVYGFAWQNND